MANAGKDNSRAPEARGQGLASRPADTTNVSDGLQGGVEDSTYDPDMVAVLNLLNLLKELRSGPRFSV